MKAKVGEKVLTVCKKHNDAIVALRGEHENATFGAPGSY